MGFQSDWEEIKQSWSSVSWPVKIIYGLMFFLSISSLASLAQTIADWKGFFLTGVEFYQQKLRYPLLTWIMSHTSARISEQNADIFTLYFFATLPLIKLGLERRFETVSVKMQWHFPLTSLILIGSLLFLMAAMGWGYIFLDSINETKPPWVYISFVAMYVISMVYIYRATDLLTTTISVAPLAIVLLTAAINQGLSM